MLILLQLSFQSNKKNEIAAAIPSFSKTACQVHLILYFLQLVNMRCLDFKIKKYEHIVYIKYVHAFNILTLTLMT
jgi:hypothetical protein